jgi:ABC-2 type transport system permease protein
MLLQYRAAAVAGFATQIFWGLIRIMIMAAFYQSSAISQPMTYEEVVTYIWLGQGMLLLVMFTADEEVGAMIRSGSVSYELVRPVNLYFFWYCRAVALRTAPLLLRSIPLFLIAGLFFHLTPPASWVHAGLFLFSALGAIGLCAAITTLMTISLIWSIAGDGINRMLPAMVIFFSGLTIPLPLFPDGMQTVIAVLPFRGLGDTPYRIYLGHLSLSEAGAAILHQGVWTGMILTFGYVLLNRGLKKLVVQGG